MSELLFEHMIRIEANGRVCRIWRAVNTASGLSTGHVLTNEEVEAIAWEKLMDLPHLPSWKFEIATLTMIANIDGVNSVEIVGRNGNGMCVHKDWP